MATARVPSDLFYGWPSTCVFVVIPYDSSFSEFHIIKDLDENRVPREYVKNPGGGADTPAVNHYLSGNRIEESEIAHLDLTDRLTLLRLAGAAEVWEEIGHFIPPSELDSLILVHEEHVPDREVENGVHVRVTLLTTRPFENDEPCLGEEIAEHYLLAANDIVELAKLFSPHHLEALKRVIEAVGEGHDISPSTSCRVGKKCPICSNRQ